MTTGCQLHRLSFPPFLLFFDPAGDISRRVRVPPMNLVSIKVSSCIKAIFICLSSLFGEGQALGYTSDISKSSSISDHLKISPWRCLPGVLPHPRFGRDTLAVTCYTLKYLHRLGYPRMYRYVQGSIRNFRHCDVLPSSLTLSGDSSHWDPHFTGHKFKLKCKAHGIMHIADVKKMFCHTLHRGIFRQKLTELLQYTNCYFTLHISFLPPFLYTF